MPQPTLEQLEKLKNEKQDIDTEQTDQEVMEGIDLVTDEADNLNTVVGTLGNDTMQQLLLAEPDMERDMDVLSETIEQIRNGMPPQQAAATRQKLEIQKASAIARQQDQKKQSHDSTMEPKGTAEDLMQQSQPRELQPQQQGSQPQELKTQPREPAMTDMDHLNLIEKSQKAKGSKRFKAVRKEYKTIGVGGWIARVASHAIVGLLTGFHLLTSQAARLAGAAKRRIIRWKNGSPKEREEQLRAREEEAVQTGQALRPEDAQPQELTPLQQIENGADDQEIVDDYRKLPLIWEKPIAENPRQKPYVSVDVFITQEDGTNDFLTGSHTSIALNYTRFNRKSGRNERCRVKFGYFMGGGLGPTTSLQIAMAGAGSYAPGRLNDDSRNMVTVGKRYEATNKQINHILNEAESYPQGGYNIVKRNCTTFVADLTQRAGIDTSDILKEEDLNLGGLWIAAPLIPLVEPLFKFKVNQKLNHVAGKKDEAYGREGKQLLSEEEKQRFQGASDYTMRLSGQSPASTIGRIRHGSATMLHSDSYDLNIKDFMSKAIEEEDHLLRAVRSVMGDDFKEDIDQFVQQMHRQEFGIVDLQCRLEDLQKDRKSSAEDRNQLRTQLVDRLQGLRKYISEWYYGVAEGDNRLIIPFLHMASIIEKEEKKYNNAYESLVDESRDVSKQLRQLHMKKSIGADVQDWNEKGELASEKSILDISELTPAECAAYVKVFGSVQNGLNMYYRKKQLDQSGKVDRALDRKFENVVMYVNALKYDEVRKGITQEDTDFAFQVMEEGQRNIRAENNINIAGLYQSLAYEKVYGGMKVWLSNIAQDHQFDSVVLEDFVTDYLLEGTHKDAFGMILSSIQDALGDQKSDEDVYQYLVENFSKVYLEQVLRAVLDRGNDDADNPDAIDKYLKQLQTDEKSTKIKAFREAVLAQSAKVRSKKREKNKQ